MFLVYQILAARLARALENNCGWGVVVAGYNRGGFLVLLRLSFPLLPVGLSFAFASLSRVTSAFLASDVVATRTLIASTERCMAPVTLAVDTHTDRLLDA